MSISEDKRHGGSNAIQDLICLGREAFATALPGSQHNFDAASWNIKDLTDRFKAKREDRIYFTRYGTTDDPLPAFYANVIKSWVILERQSISNMSHRVDAARVLWEAVLMRRGGAPLAFRWENLSEEDLNQAELFMCERKWALSTTHKQAIRLLTLANFLAARKICHPLYYVIQTPRPQDLHNHTIEGQNERMSKLPSMRAIEGLADLYHEKAKEPRDRLRLAAIALLVVSGLRIGELLTLPENCEFRETRNGKPAYGLRYYAEKTRGGEKFFDIRWLTPVGAELAQRAIAEIRKITSEARTRARILEQYPDRVPLPGFSETDQLRSKQLTRLLGFAHRQNIYSISNNHLPCHRDAQGVFYYASDVEAYLLSMRIDPLWIVNRRDGTYQLLSETLLIAFRHFFKPGATSILLVEPLSFGTINHFLSSSSWGRSVFERFNIQEENGSYCKVTSHQFRHWLNDIADKGGLPIDLQTRWMGRQHANDTKAYLHSTVEERLTWLKEGIREGKICGPVARVYFELPADERDEFLEGQIQAVHITPMGICIHDFAINPCPYHLNCARGCSEYLRTKGDQRERAYLIQVKRKTEKALDAVTEQVITENGETALAWIQHYKETLAGTEAALAVDDDPAVPEGSIVRPFDGKPTRFQPWGR
jgi:hypothetical protein